MYHRNSRSEEHAGSPWKQTFRLIITEGRYLGNWGNYPQEVVHNLGGVHNTEQRSVVNGKNLMAQREVNDIGKGEKVRERFRRS
jgi:hypothetical protein